jgi:hypothetical protein
MDLNVDLRVNAPTVVSETIEGEVVIINLDSGAYYSVRASAADIWECLENRATIGQTVDCLASRYDGDRREMESGVSGFLGLLADEELVVKTETPADPPYTPPADSDEERPPFNNPVLEKFTDMEDFLMVDPIHEVDDRGWPHKKD